MKPNLSDKQKEILEKFDKQFVKERMQDGKIYRVLTINKPDAISQFLLHSLSEIAEATKEAMISEIGRIKEAYLEIPESMRNKLTRADKQHYKNGYNQAIDEINNRYWEFIKKV